MSVLRRRPDAIWATGIDEMTAAALQTLDGQEDTPAPHCGAGTSAPVLEMNASEFGRATVTHGSLRAAQKVSNQRGFFHYDSAYTCTKQPGHDP